MPRLAPTNWQTQVRVFEAYGCTFVHPTSSHLVYDHPRARRPVIIPRYEEVPVFIIRNNMRAVGMSREDYFEILDRVGRK
ncbi:MAG: type II toxin-antitoxin system HicA family toxin [Chloroflexi bacterium]|nr:type II toxin-antitoxin system HicA family toxin [Chloroflexota bacterium]